MGGSGTHRHSKKRFAPSVLDGAFFLKKRLPKKAALRMGITAVRGIVA